MALTNNLKKQVDMPVWEWCRFAPVASSGNLGCSCSPKNSQYYQDGRSGRYIYDIINATNFWRYDTWADAWLQLASPPNATVTAASMQIDGSKGYFNRVITATGTTITTGLPFGASAKGYNIRIISGKGAGQERVITAVADPVVADSGVATAGAVGSLTDTTKAWTGTYVGTAVSLNSWVGYSLRVTLGTGVNQVRKILYNSTTVLTVGDVNKHAEDPWCNTAFSTAPAAGSQYQIESSVITVDTAWTVTPDNTSRFVIQSGGIYLLSGAAASPWMTLQYYDVLADCWYIKPMLTLMTMNSAPTDLCIEVPGENETVWENSIATGGSTTTLIDTAQSWTASQWIGYYVFIYSGTGINQIAAITANTSTTLTFATLGVAPDATSRYKILGYDGGTATSAAAYNTITDSGKSWTVNRWANHAVRIMAGTGVGQVRAIVSNTSTTLTLYSGWNVQPDSTSIYTIQADPNLIYFTYGSSAEVFVYKTGDVDMLSHGRVLDAGVACTLAALPCSSTHVIYEQGPIAISGITSATTTSTATTVNSHNLQVGQYVSIRGATTAGDVQYYNGLVQIVTVPTATTFTYTTSGTPSGAAVGVGAGTTSVVFDASKDHRQVSSGGTSTSITFAANTPSNINGWWAVGTNVGAGAQVVSGAGTTTLTMSVADTGTVSGVITFTQWAPAVTATFSSGGTVGLLTVTVSANTPSYINGWYVTGTSVGIGAVVTAGAGTANLTFSVVNTGTISGTLTFSSPWGNTILYGNSTAVTATTGAATGQMMQTINNTGNSVTVLSAMAAAILTTAGVGRYVVARRDMIGAYNEGNTNTYMSGVATGGSTTTIIDANAFWTVASSSGTAQTTTITVGTAAPSNINGWYLTAGTGINVGAQVLSGAGTTTLTLSVANSATVSGALTFCAWNTSLLVNKRVKFLTGATGGSQEAAITAVTATTGTITFGIITAPINNVTSYAIISAPIKGAGHGTRYISGLTDTTKRGKYLYIARGGTLAGFDRVDLTTDKINLTYSVPATETLTTGSQYAYDGTDRIYFTKDATQRLYYLDLATNQVHGAGMYPYTAPTATLGNRMEIFETMDGLKYMWIQRQTFTEAFRQLLFW